MKSRISPLAFVLACSFAALLTPSAKAFAENTYYRLGYTMLKDPSDPSSDVIFKVIMELSESDRDGNKVGWHIDTLYFVEPSQSGGDDSAWKTDVYDIDTEDGLWWVEHEKPDSPNADEFDVPPSLTGQAAPLNSQLSESLDFTFYGTGVKIETGKANVGYTFTKTGDATPEAESNDDDAGIESSPPIPPSAVLSACVSELPSGANEIGELSKILNLSKVTLEFKTKSPSSRQVADARGDSLTNVDGVHSKSALSVSGQPADSAPNGPIYRDSGVSERPIGSH